tara:strand:- start:733 stop:1200 length:468 start_codon:yes stop_codon:yes gene_type:complete
VVKKKKLTDKQMAKLKEHAKKHEGGMRGKHMKNMVKFMKEGDTFSTAHTKAKRLDNEGKDVKGKLYTGNKREVEFGGRKLTFQGGALRKDLGLSPESVQGKGDKFAPLAINELQDLKKIQVGKDFTFRGKKLMMTERMKKRVVLGLNLLFNRDKL